MLIPCLLAVSAAVSTYYHSLDPQSVPQHLAFHELYPDTDEGQAALQHAYDLLGNEVTLSPDVFAPDRLFALIDRLALHGSGEIPTLTSEELTAIDQLAKHLPNRNLQGHASWLIEDIALLPSSEVDLCRGLLLSLMGEESSKRREIETYEALVDLMALQILARTSFDAPPQEKIDAINTLLFEEMHLRFPPHSVHAKQIDTYTFLPSVLDSQRGVCLGVSTLYLCLAQRLALPLEAVTPPGHIYVRYRNNTEEINIETTARGIDLPSETYLGLQTRFLQTRTHKEVIGLTFMNQGAALWPAGKIKEAIAAYEKALIFLPNDPLVKEFLGYNLLIDGQKQRGTTLLREALATPQPHRIEESSLIQDLLTGRVGIAGINALFMNVDETRSSILEKQAALKKSIKKAPAFRDGWFALAITYLQLGREKEGHATLLKCHQLDPSNPLVAYYLAITSFGRHDYSEAWRYLHEAEGLAHQHHYTPRALTELRRVLKMHCPDPNLTL